MRRELLLLAVFLSSCGRPAAQGTARVTPAPGSVAFELTWDAPPASHGDNTALLAVAPADAPVAIVDVNPTMPAHGHGTIKAHQKIIPDPAVAGRFKLTGLRFVMPGTWRIDVTYTLAGEPGAVAFEADVQ